MILLFGRADLAAACRYGLGEAADGGVAVALVATTEIFAPMGFTGEPLFRAVTLVLSSTAGLTLRVTPVVEGWALDGAGGRPDSRATVTVPVPAAGERATVRERVGLWAPITVDGVARGRTGVRGAWLQVRLESLGSPVLPSGESVLDIRLEGMEVEWEALRDRQQVVNA